MNVKRKKDAAAQLVEAWKQGNTIIPFVGAGISAASGFPLITEQRDYLCKAWFYIRNGIFKRLIGEQASDTDRSASTLQHHSEFIHPSDFIDTYGWPSLNQIDADLLTYFNNSEDEQKRKEIVSNLNELEASGDFPKSMGKNFVKRLGYANSAYPPCFWIDLEYFDTPNALRNLYLKWRLKNSTGSHWGHWGHAPMQIDTVVQHVALRSQLMNNNDIAKSIASETWSWKTRPVIDWAEFLRDLSEGKHGLVDALMNKFASKRRPSKSHLMFAHLAQIAFFDTILSVNFDPFLEQGFRLEGIEPLVFEVVNDSFVPESALVKDQYSIVKLHGGSYGLRYDEKIQYSLDEQTISRVLSYAPSESPLLVMGFSGRERRMMQLLQNMAVKAQWSSEEGPLIYWLHFEPFEAVAEPVKQLEQELALTTGRKEPILFERLADPGSFLLDLYTRCTSKLPKTNQQYSCLSKGRHSSYFKVSDNRPSDQQSRQLSKELVNSFIADKKRILWIERKGDFTEHNSPTVALVKLLQEEPFWRYRLIWIDLEQHSTVESIVAQLFDIVRVFDPELPAYIQARKGQEFDVDAAAHAILRAFRRGKYTLVFDSVEAFARPETNHHGLPRDSKEGMDNDEKEEARAEQDAIHKSMNSLLNFIEALAEFAPSPSSKPNKVEESFYPMTDWYFCIVSDVIVPRHATSGCKFADQMNALIQKRLNSFKNEIPMRMTRESTSLPGNKELNSLVSYRNGVCCTGGVSTASAYIENLSKTNEEFRSKTGKSISNFLLNDSSFRNNNRTTILFYALCCFRRIRLRAAIIEVARCLFPSITACDLEISVNGMLEELTEANLIYYDNGLYWIPRYLKQASYKLLSERKDDEKDGPFRTERMIFLVMVHSRLASWYFLSGYQCSGELGCIREYFYHRLKSLYYLRHLFDQDDFVGALLDDTKQEKIKIAERLFDTEGIPFGPENENTIASRINRLRERLFTSFLKVLRGLHESIASSSTPNSWVSWIQLLDESRAGFKKGCLTETELKKLEKFNRKWLTEYYPGPNTDANQGPFFIVHKFDELEDQLLWLKAELAAGSEFNDGGVKACWDYIDLQLKFIGNKFSEAENPSTLPDVHLSSANESYLRLYDDITKTLPKKLADADLSPEQEARVNSLLFLLNPLTWQILLTGTQSQAGGNPSCASSIQSIPNEQLIDYDTLEESLEKTFRILIHLQNVSWQTEPANGQFWLEFSERLIDEIDSVLKAQEQLLTENSSATRTRLLIQRLKTEIAYAQVRYDASILPFWNVTDSTKTSARKCLEKCDELLAKITSADVKKLNEELLFRSKVLLNKAYANTVLRKPTSAKQNLHEATQYLQPNRASHAAWLARALRTKSLVLLVEADRTISETLQRHGGIPEKKAVNRLFVRADAFYEQARVELEKSANILRAVNSVQTWGRWYTVKCQYEIERLLAIALEIGFRRPSLSDATKTSARIHSHLRDGLTAIRGMLDCGVSERQKGTITTPSRCWGMMFIVSKALLNLTGLLEANLVEGSSDLPIPSEEKIDGRQVAVSEMASATKKMERISKNTAQTFNMTFLMNWKRVNEAAGIFYTEEELTGVVDKTGNRLIDFDALAKTDFDDLNFRHWILESCRERIGGNCNKRIEQILRSAKNSQTARRKK